MFINSDPDKVRTTVSVSGTWELIPADLRSVLRGAGIAVASAAVMALADYLVGVTRNTDLLAQLGMWSPFVVALIGVVINLLRKWATQDIYPSDQSDISKKD